MELQQETTKIPPARRLTAAGIAGVPPVPLLAFSPGFDLAFAQRLLGRKNGGKLSAATTRRLTQLQERFSRLVRPLVTYQERAIVRIKDDSIILEGGVTLKSRKMARTLRGARRVVAFVATVGKQVDLEIAEMMEDGRMANAYVGDALGSAAVERLANTFQDHLDCKLRRLGQTTGPRFSPGYCDWPITEQRKLFTLVRGAAAKVTLEESSLMQPRKSISAIFGVYDQHEVPATKHLIPCLRCGKKDCIARRTEADA